MAQLCLRTLGASGPQPKQACGNWANAVLSGTEGASIQLR